MSSVPVDDAPLLSARQWSDLRAWYCAHGRHQLPWRQGATPWTVLLAEIMLHRTRADAVVRLYPVLVREFPSPAAVLGRRQRWLKLTRTAGLIWRARKFVAACAMLVERHRGRIPSDREALLGLPGVGHYVSSAVRCFGFGIPGPIVDTNTIRLAGRVAGESLDPARHRSRKIQQLVARLSERGAPPGAADNYALLDLAASICRPRKPRCPLCPLQAGCATGKSVAAAAC